MFPEYRDLIAKLRQENHHFAALFDKHNELDHQIIRLTNDPASAANEDVGIEQLKKEKLALKDQLYAMIKQYEAKHQ